VEYNGNDAQTAGRHRGIPPPANTEILVQANAPVPSQLTEYYFEVTLELTEGGIVSVGVAPEGSKSWGNNSYRYQANGKKTW
jgi:hypothetical protein